MSITKELTIQEAMRHQLGNNGLYHGRKSALGTAAIDGSYYVIVSRSGLDAFVGEGGGRG